MPEKSLSSAEIQQKYLSDIADGLNRLEEDAKRLDSSGEDNWKCPERTDFENCEIIWEFINSVLFVFPEGDEVFGSFIQFLRYCSDLVWITPSVKIYEGRLAIHVILVDAYTTGRPTRN